MIGNAATTFLRTPIGIANSLPVFQQNRLAGGPIGSHVAITARQFPRPGSPLLPVKLFCGFLRRRTILFVLCRQLSEEGARRSFLGTTNLLHPLRQYLRVAQIPQLPEEPPPGLSHGFPTSAGIEISHHLGDQDASTQGYAQVVHGIGGPVSIELCMLLENPIHPIRESGFVRIIDRQLSHDKEKKRPSQEWPE